MRVPLRITQSTASTWFSTGALQRCSLQRRNYQKLRRRVVSAGVRCAAESGNDEELKSLVVKSVPLPRSPAAPPEALPIEHSSAFLLKSKRKMVDDAEKQLVRKQVQIESFEDNAVMWALKKADQSLDEIEQNPPEYAKALYEFSRGPVGTAASKGVTSAAKVTWQVGTEAVKAAAPVGKWAIQQGFKLAVTAVSKGVQAGMSSKDKKDKEK